MKQKIIIAGSGASGLLAARILAKEYDVLILESRAQSGGRIRSIQPEGFTGIIEAGPEFVHGKLPLTLNLLNEAGIAYHPVRGSMYSVIDGDWKKQQEMQEWDEMLAKMKQQPNDSTLDQFLLDEFPGKDEFHDQVKKYAQGFDLADPSVASMKALYKEWSEEDEVNYRIPGGYQQLMQYLEKEAIDAGANILFNHRIINIKHDNRAVMITTENGMVYNAAIVILTIPFPLFTDPAIQQLSVDDMPLPYQHALNKIGIGTVVKVVIEFSERLWKKDAGFIFSNELIPTWWTCLPDERYLLTGWLGGPAAKKYGSSNDGSIKEDALVSLANILQLSREKLSDKITGIHVFNWNRVAEAAMAYSYALVSSATARKVLSQAIDDKIFFCGEAYYGGENPGTVEAAFASAVEVTRSIMERK